jgi:hypothetical protein
MRNHPTRGRREKPRAARRMQSLQLHLNVIATLVRILHLLIHWSS